MLTNVYSNVTGTAKRSGTLELQTLENFLITVERRAFRIAMSSLGNREDALDVVQESMTQLVARYSSKSPEEWRPLFYRILQSRINDLHRRHNVQNRVKGWLNRFRDKDDGTEIEEDPLQNVPGPDSYSPHQQHETGRQLAVLQSALKALPDRQKQAFILRCWEGMSTAETAIAMKCSEGSVKTHYSRATHSLRATLGEHWYE
ncbi:MAG: RNA polymerase sigma factor [Porticoccus sp.]|nr:RNA polymerase sigma factor [Porticoccus sp.]